VPPGAVFRLISRSLADLFECDLPFGNAIALDPLFGRVRRVNGSVDAVGGVDRLVVGELDGRVAVVRPVEPLHVGVPGATDLAGRLMDIGSADPVALLEVADVSVDGVEIPDRLEAVAGDRLDGRSG
jgi:hypothetical protein